MSPGVGDGSGVGDGTVVSNVTLTLALAVLPAASVVVTVSTFVPACSTMPLAVQLVVPASVNVDACVAYAAAGDVMTTLGGVVSTPTTATPTPVTTREIVPPFAVKFTLPVAVDADVGLNRTVTAWLAPAPTRENAPPD